MRKVVLTMDEQNKYEVIKKLIDTNGNKHRAALKLGCTKRTINRLINVYKNKGKAGFVHKNRGKTPANKLTDIKKAEIMLFYENKYFGANIKHFTELLTKHENICYSESTIRNIFKEYEILSPKCRRKTKRQLKQKLKQKMLKAKSKKQINIIKEKIYEVDDPHPRREKSKYFGEMIQADASEYIWFGQHITYLHTAIDDSTGNIVGAYFDFQETLNGYYHTLEKVLVDYGAPAMWYTDNRTVFIYRKSGSNNIEKDTSTQFGYACKQLGIEIKTTSVSQAKGKVERLFGTLQSRLPIEMRLAGVKTIKEANAFLDNYIPKFNKQFALESNCTNSVFERIDKEKINYTLAIISDRKIDSGHCIKYHNKYYKLLDKNGHQKYYKKGTDVMVVKTFDDKLYANINGTNFALQEVAKHEVVSKRHDSEIKHKLSKKPRKQYIPPQEHPWKKASFERYLRKKENNAA